MSRTLIDMRDFEAAVERLDLENKRERLKRAMRRAKRTLAREDLDDAA